MNTPDMMKHKKSIIKALEEKGIIFEDLVNSLLRENFEGKDLKTNLCFRNRSLVEDFNERYEIDFVLQIGKYIFLIEAKSSKFDLLFFDTGDKNKYPSILNINEKEEARFSIGSHKKMFGDGMPVVRGCLEVMVKGGEPVFERGMLKGSSRDKTRDAVRQTVKNMQIYLDELVEPGKIIIPIVTTNAPLFVFDTKVNNENFSYDLDSFKKEDRVCFDFEDFCFHKRKKIESGVHALSPGSLDCFGEDNIFSVEEYRKYSKVSVFIVNVKFLAEFVKKITSSN